MAIAYLGLGTNIGNKRRNMITAAALLAERVGDILALSGFYETEPWGFESENFFLNAAVKLKTSFSPLELLRITQRIEKELGRAEKSSGVYHDRIIDIDILLYEDEVLQIPELTLPHPLMHERKFVMEPLAEIAPFVVHPVLKERIIDLKDFEKILTGGGMVFKKKGKDENAGEKKIKFSDFLRGTHKSGAAKMRAEFKYKKALRNTKKKK